MSCNINYASCNIVQEVLKLSQQLENGGAYAHVAHNLESLDLSNKVCVVGAYLEQLSGRAKKVDNAPPLDRPTRVALAGLREVLERVHATLEGIQAECQRHATRYFHYWRTPDCDPLLVTLKRQAAQLDQRLMLAMQIVAHAPTLRARCD